VTRRGGRRAKQLLDYLNEQKIYWKFKEKILDRTLWRKSFRSGYGTVEWQIAGWLYGDYVIGHEGLFVK
jgi:hypothetical protein